MTGGGRRGGGVRWSLLEIGQLYGSRWYVLRLGETASSSGVRWVVAPASRATLLVMLLTLLLLLMLLMLLSALVTTAWCPITDDDGPQSVHNVP